MYKWRHSAIRYSFASLQRDHGGILLDGHVKYIIKLSKITPGQGMQCIA